jgi:ABC-2 type transport system permease protein
MTLLLSEFRKLTYARANWALILAAVAFTAFGTAVSPVAIQATESLIGLGLDSQEVVDSVYANAISGYVFAIIVGILLMANEFRHGTAVATFLSRPNRASVLIAKFFVAAVTGALLMLASALAAIAITIPVLTLFPDAAAPSDGIFADLIVASLLSGAVLGVIGVAIAALVRSQVISIVGSLIYLFLIDPILITVLPDLGKWLPSGLITAMLSLDISSVQLGLDTTKFLEPLPAALVLVGYAAALGMAALLTSMRRDIE